ncbi:MAG: DUF3303 family protein [Candidatus Thermoplasmatota archaeon]
MLFVSTVRAMPGKFEDTVRQLKHAKVPKGVDVKHFLGLFGKPDAVIVFEAVNEALAAEFVSQFANVAEVSTALAMPVTDLRWTR